MPPMARDDGNDNLELETRDMYVRKSNAAHRAPCMSHLIHYVHPSTGEGGLALRRPDSTARPPRGGESWKRAEKLLLDY